MPLLFNLKVCVSASLRNYDPHIFPTHSLYKAFKFAILLAWSCS